MNKQDAGATRLDAQQFLPGNLAGLALLLLVLLASAGCGKAQKNVVIKTNLKPAAAFANPAPGKCPLSGQAIDPKVTFSYQGKKYAFCCEDCIEDFKADPEKYLSGTARYEGSHRGEGSAQTEAAPAPKDALRVTFGRGTQRQALIPKTWTSEPPANKMRLFQVKVPRRAGDTEDAQLVVFRFPGGGGVEANLKRWAGQFGGESALKHKELIKTAAGKEATVATYEGTYTAMSFGPKKAAPKPGYKMFAAVILMPEGQYFIKFIGPKQTIEANKPPFLALIRSFR